MIERRMKHSYRVQYNYTPNPNVLASISTLHENVKKKKKKKKKKQLRQDMGVCEIAIKSYATLQCFKVYR